ncbi:kinase-associated lipoprotein B [Anaerobacillus sp. CMMVII]|uniref:kinase-associated lipoprotein B n=1 Tax=Anaerobacillus sp. CMMVII TaxID=2755588 RepID=UPI0021B7F24E|nr:kinase-associated lipoprotein B [Anaerobacillus sp. CMMVII]MCT8138299.1 kinase-associated lipoprotein B [Anaerobacillus sp. CMMVII]
MSQQLEVGQLVTGIYKTGKYIGEITMVKETNYVMRVLAVVNHPTQGDLHNPNQVEGVFFHERRALAHREQVNIPNVYVKPFYGELPSYEESLKTALDKEIAELEANGSAFALKSIEVLRGLEKDYFKLT